jgi:hypothetical protein
MPAWRRREKEQKNGDREATWLILYWEILALIDGVETLDWLLWPQRIITYVVKFQSPCRPIDRILTWLDEPRTMERYGNRGGRPISTEQKKAAQKDGLEVLGEDA